MAKESSGVAAPYRLQSVRAEPEAVDNRGVIG